MSVVDVQYRLFLTERKHKTQTAGIQTASAEQTQLIDNEFPVSRKVCFIIILETYLVLVLAHLVYIPILYFIDLEGVLIQPWHRQICSFMSNCNSLSKTNLYESSNTSNSVRLFGRDPFGLFQAKQSITSFPPLETYKFGI